MPRQVAIRRLAAGIALGTMAAVVPVAGTADADGTWPLSTCGTVRGPVVTLPAGAGTLTLATAHGVTIEMLRGLALDAEPPVAGERPADFPAVPSDSAAPYVASGIQPFRLRHLDVEFHYDGYDPQLWPMYEYVALHGVNRLGAYLRKPDQAPHLPASTTWVLLTSYHWNGWFKQQSIPYGQWHRLADAAAAGDRLIPEGHFAARPDYALVMMDQEFGGVLAPDALRRQPWYPADAAAADRTAFEDRYYLGYTLAYTEPGRALRDAGWPVRSMYGWKPLERTWLGLGFSWPDGKPFGDRFFQLIYDQYDIHHPDVYCWQWTPANTARVLWAIDTAVAYARGQPTVKPIRPYLSTSILVDPRLRPAVRAHPLPTGDVRALFVLVWFTGIDGVVQWNWANRWNHHQPPVFEALGKDPYMPRTLMVGTPFTARIERGRFGRRRSRTFQRYEALRWLGLDPETGVARFQPMDPGQFEQGEMTDDDTAPVYSMPADALRGYLRPFTETVAAMVEGLALVKPFEQLLRQGRPVIDVPAQRQTEQILPIVRRIKAGNLHLMATYDPVSESGGPPREIVLTDFDGLAGRTLRLPADSQVRLFLLKETRRPIP